jgi:hypothetical protein
MRAPRENSRSQSSHDVAATCQRQASNSPLRDIRTYRSVVCKPPHYTAQVILTSVKCLYPCPPAATPMIPHVSLEKIASDALSELICPPYG